MTNQIAKRGSAPPPATGGILVPIVPTVPRVIRSELSRAMEPAGARGTLLPLEGPRWELAQRVGDDIDAALSVTITAAGFRDWLDPFRWGVRNPPASEKEYQERRAGMFALLSDLPACCFSPEARLGVSTEFFPGAVDIRRAVEPFVKQLRDTLDGLRRIPKGMIEVPVEAPPQDPALAIASVRVFKARQELADARLRRTRFARGSEEGED